MLPPTRSLSKSCVTPDKPSSVARASSKTGLGEKEEEGEEEGEATSTERTVPPCILARSSTSATVTLIRWVVWSYEEINIKKVCVRACTFLERKTASSSFSPFSFSPLPSSFSHTQVRVRKVKNAHT